MSKPTARIVALFLILVFLGGGINSAQGQPQRPVTPAPSVIVRTTDAWAVVLAPGSNPSSVASELGFEMLRSHVSLPNTFLLRRGGTERGGMFARSAAQALAASPRVVFYQQQVIRQHTPMNPTLEPQYANQWHLNNTGQFGGVADQDSDVLEAWNLGFTGAGVQVAVVDSGVEYTHPDLAPNYTANGSWDYINNDSNPFPDSSDETHGQSVAGVIAAAVDGTCGVGAAYEAAFSSLRTDFSFDDFTGSILLSHERHLNHIYNNSWGWNPGITAGADVEPLLFAALANNAENGRGGLGNIYVFAAGNNGNGGPTGGGENANRQGYNSSRYTISVAASTNTGVRSSYSEFGTPVHVNAPSNGGTASIYTTDRSGAAGYNGIPGSLDCTNAFGGTSSASPLVAGIVALMLDANPNLTWRDVQYILAESAEKNDSGNSSWAINGAGYDVSILYGFGRANAANAVTMAAGWANVPDEVTITSPVQTVNAAIPTTPGSPLTRTFNVTQDIALEHVEVLVNITHTWPGDVVINLTSPSGYTSQLMTRRNQNGGDYLGLMLMSVHHWGESSKGDWTLKLHDAEPAFDNDGILQNWQLILYGLPLATNDKYETPTNITALPFNDSLHTAASTRDSATYTPGCGSGNYRSVWYSYTPDVTQTVYMDTEGSNFDTVLSVWNGTTQVACDNNSGSDSTSMLSTELTQGTQYRIMVSGQDGAYGNLQFTLEGQPTVNILDASASESSGQMTFTVQLTAMSDQPVTMDYATSDGTALAGTDYVAASGPLTIPANTLSTTISVDLIDNDTYEGERTFSVTLSNLSGANAGDLMATGTITDNEPQPVVNILDASALESAGQMTFTVQLSGLSPHPVTLNYATSNGTALAGTHYFATSGPLTILANTLSATISVDLIDNFTANNDRTFGVTLSGINGAVAGDLVAVGTIIDDDRPINLIVLGDLESAPVLPDFTWTGVGSATEYRVYARNTNGTLAVDKTFAEPGTICTGVDCSISNGDYTSIPRWGLVNGSYEWWVGAKVGSSWFWSSKATFSVNVPVPVVTGLAGDLLGGWPLISWDDDPNTLWARLVIAGNGRLHDVWYERDGAGSSFTCAENVCEIAPAINWPGGNYTVSLAGWGPGGITALTPSTNNPLVLPGMPQNILGDARDGRPHITWNEDPYIEWVQVYIGGNGQLYQQWHQVPGANVTCNAGTCQLAPVIDWPGGNYQVWMQAWGSRGFSQWAPSSNNPLQLPTVPPLAPQNIDPANDDGSLQVTWDHSQWATWYQLVVLQGVATMHNAWYLADAVPCTATCTVDLVLPSNVAYTVRMRAWGPGGMSTGGTDPTTPPIGQWNSEEYSPP